MTLRGVKGRMLDLVWRCRHRLGVPPRSEGETYSRLARESAKTLRGVPGEFRFPFGPVKHADLLSLRYQYSDIFMHRDYDFACDVPTPVILDCGGNVGLSAIWFKQRFPQSRLTVFEADPRLFCILQSNLQGLGITDVELVQAAVWNRKGYVPFAALGADIGHVDEGVGGPLVPAVRLTEFIHESVDLLKIDVEGAEYEIIDDLHQSGKLRLVRHLICEVHGGGRAAQLGALISWLADAGLEVSFNHGRSAPDLPGGPHLTPFPSVPDGKFLLRLYAWRAGR